MEFKERVAAGLNGFRSNATNEEKDFLQGLKPVESKHLTSELKLRPPKENAFPAACEAGLPVATSPRVGVALLRVRGSQGTLRRAFILQFIAYRAGASFEFA
jgi:hypothetical protein